MGRLWLPSGPILGELLGYEVFADGTGLQVKVRSGRAWVEGAFAESDAEVTLAIAAADPTNPRIDRVVLRNHFGNNVTDLQVLQGTPGASPSPPALTQSTSMWEISLAQVSVPATDTSIDASQVTDERQLVNRWTGGYSKTKATDEIVNNSTTFQDDNDLFIPIRENEAWHVRFVLDFTSSTVADLKVQVTTPAGATGFLHGQRIVAGSFTWTHQDLGASLGSADGVGASEAPFWIDAVVRAGATPGRVQLQWAQNTLEVSDTKMLANSFMIAERIA